MPDAPAIRSESGEVSYRDFNARVMKAAAALREAGLRPGDRLGALMLNCPEYLELYFAAAQAGVILVPLNIRWALPDFVFTLQDSGSRGLVIDAKFLPLLDPMRAELPGLETVFFVGDPAAAGTLHWNSAVDGADPARHEFPDPDENDVAGIFYTSGTTGGPKGAMLTHRNLYSNAIHLLLSASMEGHTWLHSAPMFHLADVAALFSTTVSGGTHAFIPAFDPVVCLQAIERYKVTMTVLVPTMINMVIHHPDFDKYDVSSMKVVTYGASPMPLPLLEAARKKFGCQFRQGYGMTETSPLLTMLEPHEHDLPEIDGWLPARSAGRPVMGVEIRIVDDLDRDVPVGTPGEIIARGPNVMKGYWNRPEINREVLRGGWMHTGDIGAFDSRGFVYIMDRKKDMIKTGSENVFSPEVESMLMSHPAVLEAAVIGVPHEKWGETIRAVVALRPGQSVSEDELIAWCRERMTHFKCPTSVRFVEALPKGGTGKVQKNVLRDQFGKAGAA
jgi:long-chain acyl-CoA synthetase